VLEPLAVAVIIQPRDDVARVAVLGFEFEQQREDLPLSHVGCIGSFQPFGLVDCAVKWHDAWMNVPPHNPEESSLIWRLLRYGVRAAVSFFIVAFTATMCWVMFGNVCVNLHAGLPIRKQTVRIRTRFSPCEMTFAVTLYYSPRVRPLRISARPMEELLADLVLAKLPTTLLTDVPDFSCTTKETPIYRQLTCRTRPEYVSACLCLTGFSYLILAGYLRRRRHKPAEPH
jgi:hypothetical protein